MTVTTAKWSLDDYHQMIEAGILVDHSVELLNGEIIEMAHSIGIKRADSRCQAYHIPR